MNTWRSKRVLALAAPKPSSAAKDSGSDGGSGKAKGAPGGHGPRGLGGRGRQGPGQERLGVVDEDGDHDEEDGDGAAEDGGTGGRQGQGQGGEDGAAGRGWRNGLRLISRHLSRRLDSTPPLGPQPTPPEAPEAPPVPPLQPLPPQQTGSRPLSQPAPNNQAAHLQALKARSLRNIYGRTVASGKVDSVLLIAHDISRQSNRHLPLAVVPASQSMLPGAMGTPPLGPPLEAGSKYMGSPLVGA